MDNDGIWGRNCDSSMASQTDATTQCKHLLKSAWEFDYKRKHPKAPSAAMQFGSLVHQLVLEPEQFEQNYDVVANADDPLMDFTVSKYVNNKEANINLCNSFLSR